MKSLLARMVLALALFVLLGWPALATMRAAWEGAGSGPMPPASADSLAGRVLRPLGLARTTLALVLLTEALALPVGVALALVLFRTDVWGRRPLLGLIALAAFVPLPLHATAWLGALGNVGRTQALGVTPILVRLPGAAVVHALAALPWVVLVAGVGARSVEPELEEGALLDLPAWRVLTAVTLRRSLGAVAGAALAVAVLTAGDMTVTDLLQVRTYAEESYTQAQLGGVLGAAAAIVLPQFVVLFGSLVGAARGLLRADPARLVSGALRGKVWRLGRWRVPLGIVVVGTVGNLAALPLYALVWRAGRVGGKAALGIPPHWSVAGLFGTLRAAAPEVAWPLGESALWAALGATLSVLVAWPLAWLSRRPGPWRWVAVASAALALATPGPVAGIALKIAYLQVPPIYDTAAILVIAAGLRTFPYALLVLWPAVRSLPPEYLDAAALDGYGAWGQVRRVAVPLTAGAVGAAWGVAFALALGELPASNLVAPAGLTTLSLVVWSLLHTGVESHLAGVALVLLAAVAASGLLAAWTLSRVALLSRSGRDFP